MPARNVSTQMCFVARTTTVIPVVTFGFLWKRTIFVEHLLESAKKGKVCLHLSQSCAEKQVSGNFLSISDASSPDPRNLFFFTFVHIYQYTQPIQQQLRPLKKWFSWIPQLICRCLPITLAILLGSIFSKRLWRQIKENWWLGIFSVMHIIFRAVCDHIDWII